MIWSKPRIWKSAQKAVSNCRRQQEEDRFCKICAIFNRQLCKLCIQPSASVECQCLSRIRCFHHHYIHIQNIRPWNTFILIYALVLNIGSACFTDSLGEAPSNSLRTLPLTSLLNSPVSFESAYGGNDKLSLTTSSVLPLFTPFTLNGLNRSLLYSQNAENRLVHFWHIQT